MKIKTSYFLWIAVVANAASLVSNIYGDKPALASFGMLMGAVGWLTSQIELEELRGD